jgi:prevent-host-death family protein
MAKTISQGELRNDNAKVIDAVTAGETFIVTRNGEPVGELRPLRSKRPSFVSRGEVVQLTTARVRVDVQQFRADIDRLIDQRLA